MKVLLPWVDYLLTPVKEEFKKPEPVIHIQTASGDDQKAIQEILQKPSGFDSDSLIRETLESCVPQVATHGAHKIRLVCKQLPPLQLWFRIMRIFVGESPACVTYFGHPSKRVTPKKGEPIEPIHINGGYANQCNPQSIVIYREEDATRVLVHELFHATCSDPTGLSLPDLEADTEAWAEVLYCAIDAKGNEAAWKRCLDQQIQFAISQASYLSKHHNVKEKGDYAWRYTTGRLSVWHTLGLLPSNPTKRTARVHRTLRLTKKDIHSK